MSIDKAEIVAVEVRNRVALLGIAYTFQVTSIYPRLSVFDNVAYGLEVRGMGKKERRAKAAEARAAADAGAAPESEPAAPASRG